MLSIIIPLYNGKRYLNGIIEAFSAQELPMVELVFVDDGSTDGSFEALQQLSYPAFLRVKVIHQSNAGVSAARNRGIEEAEGEWIAFMDADDRLSPDFGLVLRRQMEQNAADVFLFRHRAVQNWEQAISVDDAPVEFERTNGAKLVRQLMITPTRFGVYDLLIRRSLLLEQGIRFSEGYPYYEDYDFLYRVFSSEARFRATEHALYDYHANHTSAMSAFSDERVRCLELYRKLTPRIEQNVPAVAPAFRVWAEARIYWSVLWQASVVKADYADFRAFARDTGADRYMSALTDFPERRVAWTAALFGVCPRAYYLLARAAAGQRQKKRLQERRDAVLRVREGEGL